MVQTAPRIFSSDTLEEAFAHEGTNESQNPAAAQAVDRVFQALARMEALVDGYTPAVREREAQMQDELHQLQQENANLKADRQELVQAVRALKGQNDTLAQQMDEISSRLDGALERIAAALQE